MKLDGGTMETTEPTEAVAAGEPASSQENLTQQPQSQELADTETAGAAAPEVNGRPVAKVKPKTVDSKTHLRGRPAGGAAMSSPRPGTSSSRVTSNSASQNAAAAGRRVAVANASGAVPKRPAAASTARNPPREPTKTSAGPARTASATPATAANNGSRPAAPSNSVQKRTAPETVNGARPKTTLSASRTVASTTSKSTASTSTKVGAAAAKTTRPAAVPPVMRPHFTTSRPTATTRPPSAGARSSSTASSGKTAASRVTTAPSAGRPAAAQLPKSDAPAAKKDVSRPPSTTAARKPTMATASAATRKPDPSKLAATVKLTSTSKQSTTAAADTKASQLKHQQRTKSPATKKTVGEVRSTAANSSSTMRTPPISPATRPGLSNLGKSKYGKPTQNVSPFAINKKTVVSKTKTSVTGAQRAPGTQRPVGPKTVDVAVAEVEPQAELHITSAPVAVPTSDPAAQAASAPQEVTPNQEVVSLHRPSPISTAPTIEQPENTCSLQLVQEEIPTPSQPAVPPVAQSPLSPKETTHFSAEQTTSASAALPTTASAISLMVPSTNLNDEEDEEEREGSQLVSVSEMSGTTQPTEESRPGSAGLAAGSAWRASGALLSELDSEEVSGSQQGASELSAPGVLEGTESMDDLGDGSLKGAIDMEGASAGSPDFEKVPDIPVNDFDEDEDEDDSDRVCDMDVGSERTDELPRPRHDNDVDDEDDDDVEMASEGVTESGLESYGNADEDDFAEDERLDNLNRMAQPPPPPVLPSAPAAQWDQPNPFADPWAEPLQPEQAAAVSPLADAWQLDSETPTQAPVQAWLELGSDPSVEGNQGAPDYFSVKDEHKGSEAQMYTELSGPAREQNPIPALLTAPGMSQASTLSSETSTPDELGDCNREGKHQPPSVQATPPTPHHQDLDVHTEKREGVNSEAPSVSANEVFGGTTAAPTSNPSSSSVTEDEASDTEGEAQLEELLEAPVVCNLTFDCPAPTQRCLSTVEEGEEAEVSLNGAPAEDATPPSATSMASYGFDTTTTTSNAQSTAESCIKSPGIFSLEELPEEAKEPHAQPCLSEQQYIKFGKEGEESAALVGEEALESEEGPDLPPAQSTLPQQEENTDDVQPPYYSGICEKTEDSVAGLSALPLPHRRDHAACPRAYCDIVKQHGAAAAPPKLTCADLPPRSLAQQALSPQLRRLEQHQRQLQEMQQRRAQQSRPLEESEQERKRREEEEQRRKKEEAEEEIKRNKEEEGRRKREEEQELAQRKDLELKLQQQQEELKQRQQIMQWQQELLQTQGQAAVLSPSSGLCTIYEALENSDEEEAEGEEDGLNELKHNRKKQESKRDTHQLETAESTKTMSAEDQASLSDSPPPTDSLQSYSCPSPHPPESPDRPPPLDLDWGKKVDIVQQLINQTLLLNGDSCSSLLLLPGGAGGTLSPLESSLWPSLLPPLTPPSATVTSVSSFSPEATGSSPQGEWTVVELETHH